MKRNLLTMLLVSASALSLVACGNEQTPSEEKKSEVKSEQPSEVVSEE